jgi:hypothetical protein
MTASRQLVGFLSTVGCALALSASGVAGQQPTSGGAPALDTLPDRTQRDPIGDLNATAVRTGDFPGAIVLPGTDVSLAIGGFVKTAMIVDSHVEQSGANLLPGTFGPGIGGDGNFSVDATLTRLYFDGRASVGDGSVRGYVEWDFNASNSGSLGVRPRLAFGSWDTGRGVLLAGHHWSTFMDPRIVPESMTEPTVSGAVFNRQAQVRWTQPLSSSLRLHLAAEAPSSTDLFSQDGPVGKTRLPDVVLAAEFDPEDGAHLRAAGILRRVESDEIETVSPATGWGVSLAGYLDVGEADRLAATVTLGAGIARYLLGSAPRAGGFVDPTTGQAEVLANRGGLLSYSRTWGEKTRSVVALGGAWGEVIDEQPDDPFRSTVYGFVNLLRSPAPYLTVGLEYAYARYATDSGAVTDNHRLVLGFQIF